MNLLMYIYVNFFKISFSSDCSRIAKTLQCNQRNAFYRVRGESQSTKQVISCFDTKLHKILFHLLVMFFLLALLHYFAKARKGSNQLGQLVPFSHLIECEAPFKISEDSTKVIYIQISQED